MCRKTLKPAARGLGFTAAGKAAEQVAVGAAIIRIAGLRSVKAETDAEAAVAVEARIVEIKRFDVRAALLLVERLQTAAGVLAELSGGALGFFANVQQGARDKRRAAELFEQQP